VERKPLYAGKIAEKDEQDILFWGLKNSPLDRLQVSWRLNCINHGVDITIRLDKSKSYAYKRT